MMQPGDTMYCSDCLDTFAAGPICPRCQGRQVYWLAGVPVTSFRHREPESQPPPRSGVSLSGMLLWGGLTIAMIGGLGVVFGFLGSIILARDGQEQLAKASAQNAAYCLLMCGAGGLAAIAGLIGKMIVKFWDSLGGQ